MLTLQRDFNQLLKTTNAGHAEAITYLLGGGMLNDTLVRLARDLEEHQIPYCIIGATALYKHGYQRLTTDIDVLMSPEGLEAFQNHLVGRGYRPAFNGATKKFRATENNVPIEIITSGEYPGDGRSKSVVFPDPADCYVMIEGVRTIPLPTLVELKLASGLTGRGRLKDLADVQELIKILSLPREYADQLDESVRAKFVELYDDQVE